MADAAYVILTRDSKNFTRNFCIDEDILREVGVKDFDVYAVKPGITN
jgi:citronellol/citronellal dehydrogenase